MVTLIPSEFKILGTWMDLTGKYDAIVSQNILIPLKTKINLEDGYLEINSNKISFEYSHHHWLLMKFLI